MDLKSPANGAVDSLLHPGRAREAGPWAPGPIIERLSRNRSTLIKLISITSRCQPWIGLPGRIPALPATFQESCRLWSLTAREHGALKIDKNRLPVALVGLGVLWLVGWAVYVCYLSDVPLGSRGIVVTVAILVIPAALTFAVAWVIGRVNSRNETAR